MLSWRRWRQMRRIVTYDARLVEWLPTSKSFGVNESASKALRFRWLSIPLSQFLCQTAPKNLGVGPPLSNPPLYTCCHEIGF